MLTGMLGYADRVQPGWTEAHAPSIMRFAPGGFVGEGDFWCKRFLRTAHGEDNLRGVDHREWTAWRDAAFAVTMQFRAEFDPENRLPTLVAGPLEFEELCRRLGEPDGPNPLAGEKSGARRAHMREASEAARHLLELIADDTDAPAPIQAISDAYAKGRGIRYLLSIWTVSATAEAADGKGIAWEDQFREIRQLVDEFAAESDIGVDVTSAVSGAAGAAELVLALHTAGGGSDALLEQIERWISDLDTFMSVCFPLLALTTFAIAQRGLLRGVTGPARFADFFSRLPPY